MITCGVSQGTAVEPDIQFSERIINLTKVEFNKEEISTMFKGPKYTPAIINKNSLDTLITDTAIVLKQSVSR